VIAPATSAVHALRSGTVPADIVLKV